MKLEDVAVNLLADKKCSNCGNYCETTESETCEKWKSIEYYLQHQTATLKSIKSKSLNILNNIDLSQGIDKFICDDLKKDLLNIVPLTVEKSITVEPNYNTQCLDVTIKLKENPFAEIIVLDIKVKK